MDLTTPLASIAPGLDSAALTVLAGTDSPMSATQIQRVAGRGSRYGLVLVLERLTKHGLVTAIPASRGNLYQLNRDHVLSPVVTAAAQARVELSNRLAEAVGNLDPEPLSAAMYGSVARGDATPDSDIDLLLIVSDDVDPDSETWGRQVDHLERCVRQWSGNRVQTVTVPQTQLTRMTQAHDHIINEWFRDCRTIAGDDARGLIQAARKGTAKT